MPRTAHDSYQSCLSQFSSDEPHSRVGSGHNLIKYRPSSETSTIACFSQFDWLSLLLSISTSGVLRIIHVMASTAFKELSLVGSVACFSRSFTSPSVLHFPSPKLQQITSSFTCCLCRILCVVQPDGELHLPAALDSNLCFHFQRCFLRSKFLSSATLA